MNATARRVNVAKQSSSRRPDAFRFFCQSSLIVRVSMSKLAEFKVLEAQLRQLDAMKNDSGLE